MNQRLSLVQNRASGLYDYTPVLTPFDIDRVRDCKSNDKNFLYYLVMHRNKHKKTK